MKTRILKYVSLSFMLLAFNACDVTDLVPVNVLSEDVAYSSKKNVELSMAGVYDAAQSGFYGTDEGNNRGYIFGAAHIQQSDMRGEDMLLINVFYAFTYQATYDPTTANNVGYWANGFRLINLCNLFIEGVQGAVTNGVLTQEEADAYEAEARMLRAITYHTLVIHFARPYRDNDGDNLGLPIFTKGVNGPDQVAEVTSTGRSTVAEVYDFILEDLDFAEQHAVERADYPVTRVTEGAAIAMKTRVYLHMGDWANVITEGNKIVSANAPFTGGGYSLGTSVETPWANNESSESIFSMEMSPNDNLNTNAALARMLGSPAEEIGARGEYAISPIIWNQSFWHEDDLRRTLLVRDNGIRYFTHKYRDYTNWTDFAPIIRYAEVLMNVAEAEARTNGLSPRALALLNAIRDRAKSGAMPSYVMGDFANGTALVQAILNERRIEFLAEGLRWYDLHRNGVDPDFSAGGIPAKLTPDAVTSFDAYTIGVPPTVFGVAAVPYDNSKYLWPIPADEVARNPTLADQQNPGY